VLRRRTLFPIAVLLVPVVLEESALVPNTVLFAIFPAPLPAVSPLISVSLSRFTTLVVALVNGIILVFLI
jgi:hypothetical protein